MAKKELPQKDHNEGKDYLHLVQCKFRGCREMFKTTRIDKFYCNDQCRDAEKIAVLRDKNALIQQVVDAMLNNEKILMTLYESGNREISKDALLKKGFSLTANYLLILDESNGLFTMKFFDYGIKLVGEALYRIEYFVGSILKTK